MAGRRLGALHVHAVPPAVTGGAMKIRPGAMRLYDRPLPAGGPGAATTPAGTPHPRHLGTLTVPAALWDEVLALLDAGARAQRVALTASGPLALPASVRAAMGRPPADQAPLTCRPSAAAPPPPAPAPAPPRTAPR